MCFVKAYPADTAQRGIRFRTPSNQYSPNCAGLAQIALSWFVSCRFRYGPVAPHHINGRVSPISALGTPLRISQVYVHASCTSTYARRVQLCSTSAVQMTLNTEHRNSPHRTRCNSTLAMCIPGDVVTWRIRARANKSLAEGQCQGCAQAIDCLRYPVSQRTNEMNAEPPAVSMLICSTAPPFRAILPHTPTI